MTELRPFPFVGPFPVPVVKPRPGGLARRPGGTGYKGWRAIGTNALHEPPQRPANYICARDTMVEATPAAATQSPLIANMMRCR